MNITSFLDERAVSCGIKSQRKDAVIQELVECLAKAGSIKAKDVGPLVQTLLERESLGSTGIGQGVAIPHGKSDRVSKLVSAFALSAQGVDFDALDGEPVYVFCLLVAPENSAGPHLKALARISRLLKDRHFRESLRKAKDEKTLIKLIREEDERRH